MSKTSQPKTKIANMSIKISVLFVFLACMSLHTYSQSTTNKRKTDQEVISWVENYFLKEDYFSYLKDSAQSPLSSKDIEGKYHIHFIESKKIDTLKVTIYQIGINASSGHDFLLITIGRKKSKTEFQTIGSGISIENSVLVYKFFEKYTQFSSKTRVICYQRVIGDYYYFDIVFPNAND